MKKYYVGFLVGCLMTIILIMAFPVYADTLSAAFNSVNISINGTTVARVGEDYTLSNGTKTPFSIMYNGTTYLPMRKLGELINKDVQWNAKTSTATINDLPGSTGSSSSIVLQEKIKLLGISSRLNEIAQEILYWGNLNNTFPNLKSSPANAALYNLYYETYKASKTSFNNSRMSYSITLGEIALKSVDLSNKDVANKLLTEMMPKLSDAITIQDDLFVTYDGEKHYAVAEKLATIKEMNAVLSVSLLSSAQ